MDEAVKAAGVQASIRPSRGWRARRALGRAAFPATCLALKVITRLRRRRVFVYYNFPDFARKAAALADLLLRRGFRAELRCGMSFTTRALLKASPDLWIGFWNEVPVEMLPRNYVFLNGEPLNVKKWSANSNWNAAMKGAREVWGYSRGNAEHVQSLGVLFHFVPFGYAPYYETIFREHCEGKSLTQDIDVLFFGEVCERRRLILDELMRSGLNVRVVSRANPAYGAELDELLARSKIILGIHYYDDPRAQIADLARLDHLLANRLFVVYEKLSEFASDPEFEENVTTCGYREIPAACARLLADPEERARRAAKAYEWFKSEYALDSFIPYDHVRSFLRTE
jgi:hypothetical protein